MWLFYKTVIFSISKNFRYSLSLSKANEFLFDKIYVENKVTAGIRVSKMN